MIFMWGAALFSILFLFFTFVSLSLTFSFSFSFFHPTFLIFTYDIPFPIDDMSRMKKKRHIRHDVYTKHNMEDSSQFSLCYVPSMISHCLLSLCPDCPSMITLYISTRYPCYDDYADDLMYVFE